MDVHQLYKFFILSSIKMIRTVEPPSNPNIPDRLYWPLTKSGHFTTKSSGYYFLSTLQQNDIWSMTDSETADFFSILWGLNIMPKWKLFLWKLWNNALATNYNLRRRNIGTDASCPICLQPEESLLHLLIFCPLAAEVWLHAFSTLNVTIPTHSDFRCWLQETILHFRKTDGYYGTRIPLFIGTLWGMSTTRNAQVFRHQRVTIERFLSQLLEGMEAHNIFISNTSPITNP